MQASTSFGKAWAWAGAIFGRWDGGLHTNHVRLFWAGQA